MSITDIFDSFRDPANLRILSLKEFETHVSRLYLILSGRHEKAIKDIKSVEELIKNTKELGNDHLEELKREREMESNIHDAQRHEVASRVLEEQERSVLATERINNALLHNNASEIELLKNKWHLLTETIRTSEFILQKLREIMSSFKRDSYSNQGITSQEMQEFKNILHDPIDRYLDYMITIAEKKKEIDKSFLNIIDKDEIMEKEKAENNGKIIKFGKREERDEKKERNAEQQIGEEFQRAA